MSKRSAAALFYWNFASADRTTAARQMYSTRSVMANTWIFSPTLTLIFTGRLTRTNFGLIAQRPWNL